jgi:nicotinamide-nucleotide amidase
MPSVEILAVGTELLLGQLTDTNTAHIARALADAGIDVFATHSVGDNRERIAAAIRRTLERADGVVTSGGLGPTVDDLTKEAVCDALALGTELHEPSLRSMEAFFAKTGRVMRENNRKQAEVPAGSYVMANANGTAPGFVAFRDDGKFVASMPGVPQEMKPMLSEELVPLLRDRFHLHAAIYTRVLHTAGIAESEIDHRIADLFRAMENPKIAVLAHGYRCDVKIMAKADSEKRAVAMIDPVEREMLSRLEGFVYGAGDETLPSAIHALLQKRGETIAVAESCTGGGIAADLTSVPGSSRSFMGGVVAYDNTVKVKVLGVRDTTLSQYGAVSEETALEMAQGVRARLGTDIGLSTTGIAGPDGGSAEKPVGLVWTAIATPHETHAVKNHFRGDRGQIQGRARVHALTMLWKALAR